MEQALRKDFMDTVVFHKLMGEMLPNGFFGEDDAVVVAQEKDKGRRPVPEANELQSHSAMMSAVYEGFGTLAMARRKDMDQAWPTTAASSSKMHSPCVRHPTSSSSSSSPSIAGDASELRKLGNSLFQKQDWKGAIDCYTRCITLIIQQKLGIHVPNKKVQPHLVGDDVGAETPNDNGTANAHGSPATAFNEKNMLSLVFSNRAEAWMKLERYDEALSDSNTALFIDPSHVKSLFRKGRALHGLGRFEHACCCFKKVISHSPDDLSVRALLDRSKQALGKRSSDVLDGFSDYLLGMSGPPILPDYIGPVVVKETRNKNNGRGLFTTKDVKQGTLLVVSNAMAVQGLQDSADPALHLHHTDHRITKFSVDRLATKLVNLGMELPTRLHQLYSLCSSKHSSSLMPVPTMDLFSDPIQTNEAPLIDVPLIQDIVQLNAFHTHTQSKMYDDAMTQPYLSGLWLLPSFINHSCIPNAKWHIVGETMVIHASSDISCGDEVVIPYFDTHIPLKIRVKWARNWGFVCECDRCVVEKSMEANLEEEVQKFVSLYDQASDEYMSWFSNKSLSMKRKLDPNAKFPACSKMLKLYARVSCHVDGMPHLSEVQKRWILGGFLHAFAWKYILFWRSYKFGSPMYWSAKKVFDVLRACEPGNELTVTVASRLYTMAIEYGRPQEISSLLLEEWKGACVSYFGRVKGGVWGRLLIKEVYNVPGFMHEGVSSSLL